MPRVDQREWRLRPFNYDNTINAMVLNNNFYSWLKEGKFLADIVCRNDKWGLARHPPKFDGYNRSWSRSKSILSSRGIFAKPVRNINAFFFLGSSLLCDVLHCLSLFLCEYFRSLNYHHLPRTRRSRIIGRRFG